MDSYPFPIPIQYDWRIPVNEIRGLKDTSKKTVTERKEIKELPGVQFELILRVYNHCNNFFRVGIYLNLLNFKEETKIRAIFAFSPKSAQKWYGTFEGSNLRTSDKNTWGRYIFDMDDIFECPDFIVNDHLSIDFKGILTVESQAVVVKESLDGDSSNIAEGDEKPRRFWPQELRIEETKIEFQPSLGKRLWNREDKDFTFIVGKGNRRKTEIKIHKLILFSQSSVFNKVINKNKVEISDFNFETVQAAVEYCYDRGISKFLKPLTNQIDLFKFADKYGMEDLKQHLELIFVENLLPENIVEITTAAIITKSLKLQNLCLRYMLIFMRFGIPVLDFDNLDKDFAYDLLTKAFSSEHY